MAKKRKKFPKVIWMHIWCGGVEFCEEKPSWDKGDEGWEFTGMLGDSCLKGFYQLFGKIPTYTDEALYKITRTGTRNRMVWDLEYIKHPKK